MDNTIEESDNNRQHSNEISLKHKLAYGVGHVLNDVCASMWFTYTLVYFHLVLGFSPTYAGLVLLIGQVADALATPFVGLHSDKDDNFWLCQYGKRKTWHLTGTICVLGTFPFIFSQCIGCQNAHQWAQLIYYASFVIIFQFGWASVQISHLSMIPDLTPFNEVRATLTAIRYSFTVFSNILVYCVTWAILHITSESSTDKIGPKDAYKFQQIVLIGMFIGLLATIIFHIVVKEASRDNLDGSRGQSPRRLNSPFSLFKDIELYQIACIYMPTRLFVNLTQTYIPLYLHETLNMPATSLAIIPLIMYLSSFKASFAIQYLNAKLGRKLSYLIGALMGIGAYIWIWYGNGDQFVHLFIYPVSLLLGSAGSMMLVTSLAITADYIGHSTENGAFVYGIMSFTDKLSNGLAVILIQYLKSKSGYKMDVIKKKFPNHTEIAYREAVSKLKYLLAESYAPKLTIPKPIIVNKRPYKESIAQQAEESGDDAEVQSVMSDFSKKEQSTRSKSYYPSRLSHFPHTHVYSCGNERVAVPPTELSLLIERQEEYIGQLERESQYCKEELKNLVEKVKEVVAENEVLQDKNKSGFFKAALEGYTPGFDDSSIPKADYHEGESRLLRKSITSTRPLEGPSIVFESRISELEAQLTQAKLELRKAREENQESLNRLSDRNEDHHQPQLRLELERALREKRELEARADEMQRELLKIRSRDADVEIKSKRVMEVAQHAEYEKAQAEAEVRRLKDELERRQEKLKEALHESNRRIMEEKDQMERRFSQQVEQLSADVASHWEEASKSHLEAEKQRREIADLKRELAQKNAFIEDLKKELQQKTSKLQEELSQAISEKDTSQEEISNLKLTSERNERQARQEQSRLQAEINSYKMRLERADADLVHARRENLRLTEQIGALEKEISMNRIMEETRVGPQPSKLEKLKDEKDKDKELASLIYDLENKQGKKWPIYKAI